MGILHTIVRNILTLLVMAVCVMPLSVSAQSSFDYKVSPLVIDRDMAARDTDQITITIENRDSRPLRIYPTVNAIAVDGAGDVTEFISSSMADWRTTITAWLSIPRTRIEVPPGETKTVTLGIKMPPTVEPGEYHAYIGFPTGSNRPRAEAEVMEGQAPGVVVRIGVGKDTFSALRLSQFFIDRFQFAHEESHATIHLENRGTEAATPTGELIFYNSNGEEVAAAEVRDTKQIGPGAASTVSVPIPSSLGMGRFKANLNLQYGDGQLAQVQDTSFFYVVPLPQLLATLGTLLGGAIVTSLYIHRRYSGAGYAEEESGIEALPMYLRQTSSEAHEHDIDLTKKDVA